MTKSFAFTLLFFLMGTYALVAQSQKQTTYVANDYEINFPDQFNVSTQPLASALGQLIMTIIAYEPPGNANDSNYVYMVMEATYPDSAIHSDKVEMHDEFFKASINGVINNVKGRLIKETKGLSGKYPNRTVEIDFQDGLVTLRMTMILRERTMIIIQTITNSNNYPNASIHKFVNSFKIK
jgi:hypothetical protein